MTSCGRASHGSAILVHIIAPQTRTFLKEKVYHVETAELCGTFECCYSCPRGVDISPCRQQLAGNSKVTSHCRILKCCGSVRERRRVVGISLRLKENVNKL